MPLKFSEIAKSIRTVSVKWGDDKIVVQYNPGANTVARSLEAQRRIEDDEANGVEVAVDSVLDVVVGWDIMLDEKATLPITRDNLLQFPVALLTSILQEIADDQAPKSKKSER